jgi:homoserine O-acetyltransferase
MEGTRMPSHRHGASASVLSSLSPTADESHRIADAVIGDLRLESGIMLPGATLRVEIFGRLAVDGRNAVLLLPGLSADTHAADRPGDRRSGWWSRALGPGRGIDTDRWCVVVVDALGGSHGSTAARSLGPDGRVWGGRFPRLTIRDLAAASERLAYALRIERWAGALGLSFGGMQALELLVTSDRVDRVAVVAAPAITDAEQIATNSLQIDVVRADPDYADGDYLASGTRPRAGLALARRLGMLNYRGQGELHVRFGRTAERSDGEEFAVESHARKQAARFAETFDAHAFVTLVDAKNTHDIGRGRGGLAEALSAVDTPLLVIGIDSDRLFPVAQQREITRLAPSSVTGREPLVLESPHGHDSFLIAQEWMGDAIGAFLAGSTPRTSATRPAELSAV